VSGRGCWGRALGARAIPLAWLLSPAQPVWRPGGWRWRASGFAGILIVHAALALSRRAVRMPVVTIPRMFDADLVLISPRTIQLVRCPAFRGGRLCSRPRDSEVAGHAGELEPESIWRNPRITRSTRSIWRSALKPNDPLFLDPEAEIKGQALTQQRPGLLPMTGQGRNSVRWRSGSAKPHR